MPPMGMSPPQSGPQVRVWAGLESKIETRRRVGCLRPYVDCGVGGSRLQTGPTPNPTPIESD